MSGDQQPRVVFLGYAHDARGGIAQFRCRLAGLRVFDIDGRGPYTPGELARTVDSGAMWTFVAHR